LDCGDGVGDVTALAAAPGKGHRTTNHFLALIQSGDYLNPCRRSPKALASSRQTPILGGATPSDYRKIDWHARRASGSYHAQPMSAKKLDSDINLTKELTVQNKLGIHARPAALFVKTANRFSCEIFVEKDGEKVNGKSIMGLMMLAAGPGSKLTVYAEGADASQAIGELEKLLKRKFDED